MAKLWQYLLSVIVFVLIIAGCLWAFLGHKMNSKPQRCSNAKTRDSHPLIYFPRRNLCYALHTQGPCPDRNWLTIQGLKVNCSPNTCIDHFDSHIDPDDQVVVPFNNTCYKLGESCGKNGSVIIYGPSGYPDCKGPPPPIATSALLPGNGGMCEMGTFLFMGSCLPADEPDFD